MDVCYSTYSQVLLQFSEHHSLDELFARSKCVWTPSYVTLGAFMDVCAQTRDSKRAEELWDLLVKDYRVDPTIIAYTALAKVHHMWTSC